MIYDPVTRERWFYGRWYSEEEYQEYLDAKDAWESAEEDACTFYDKEG